MAKVALLIGVSEYEPGLTALPAAVRDVEALKRVLQDPEMGGFDTVKALTNPDPLAMQSEIQALFTEQRSRDDLVLLYFSGHGIKDDSGNLYFATSLTRKNTKGDLIRATAVAARFVHEMLHDSPARRQVVILDCCFSGAFDPALRFKDDSSVDLLGQLGAEGRVVLASSSSTQYSLEEAESDLSLYTRYLIEGIETGAGDLNEDGQISVQELHHYAFERVQTTAPNMTPKLITLKDLGFEIVLAKAKITDPRLRYRKTVARYADGETIRPAGRAVLDTLQQQLNLTSAEVAEIETEVFRPYRERLTNLQKYRSTLLLEVEHQYPLNETARDALESLRQLLGLRVEDVAPIEQEIRAELTQIAEQALQENVYQAATTDLAEKQELLSAEDFFNHGLEKHTSKDYQGAILAFNEAIRLKPDYAEAYANRGQVKYDLDDKIGAIEDCNEAIRLKPDYAEAYLIRGRFKYDLDKLEAIEDLDEAIRLQPDYAEAYLLCGLANFDLWSCSHGKKEAIENFDQVIRLKPDSTIAYYWRGVAKAKLGDNTGATVDYDKVIQLQADCVLAYKMRGDAKYALGDRKGAIEDYDAAIRLQPDYADAYYSRGVLKSNLFGERQGAIIDYQDAARLYQKQGWTTRYRDALEAIEKLEKKGKGLLGGLFDALEAMDELEKKGKGFLGRLFS